MTNTTNLRGTFPPKTAATLRAYDARGRKFWEKEAAITATGGTGILLNNNTGGSSFTFSGGITLNGVGATFTATTSGTLTMTGTNTRPVDAWSQFVYTIASDAHSAARARDSHEQVSQQLKNLRDQVTGVSIDEEAAMLMRFQRAYEANARFFQVADQTLDLLMQLVGR